MGLFKSIGRAFGRAVEKVGDFFGSSKISQVGRNIQNACAEKVASEKSYDKKEANIYTTERLGNILSDVSAGYYAQATTLENQCIRLVELYLDRIINIIKSVPNNTLTNANLASLERTKERISKKITGALREPLAKRLSLDDSECLKILKMDSGDEKRTMMSNFTKKVFAESLGNLADEVRESLNDVKDDVEEYLEAISEEQEKQMKLLKDSFDKIVNEYQDEQEDTENSCIKPMTILSATDEIQKILT